MSGTMAKHGLHHSAQKSTGTGWTEARPSPQFWSVKFSICSDIRPTPRVDAPERSESVSRRALQSPRGDRRTLGRAAACPDVRALPDAARGAGPPPTHGITNGRRPGSTPPVGDLGTV